LLYDLSTGRATVGDVMTDIGIFIEGWIVEMIAPTYDAELEKTHAYALFLLLIPGLLLPWYNLIPFFNRGSEFQVHPDGSVSVRRGDSWEPLVRLPGKVSAEFFRQLLAGRGFEVESPSSSSNSFTARRK
jgi:hypothetical protein